WWTGSMAVELTMEIGKNGVETWVSKEGAEYRAEVAVERCHAGAPSAPRARRFRTGQMPGSFITTWQRRQRTHSLALIRPSGSIAPTVHFVSHSRHSRPHCGRRFSQSKTFSLAGIAMPAPSGQR